MCENILEIKWKLVVWKFEFVRRVFDEYFLKYVEIESK